MHVLFFFKLSITAVAACPDEMMGSTIYHIVFPSRPCFLAFVLELQHGRMAMLGICGLIAPEFVRVPGEIYQNVSVLDAHNAMVSTVHDPFRLSFHVMNRSLLSNR